MSSTPQSSWLFEGLLPKPPQPESKAPGRKSKKFKRKRRQAEQKNRRLMAPAAKPGGQSAASAMAVFRMLADYFGDERRAVEFCRAFAGVTLRIPSADAVEAVVRDRRVLVALSRDPSTEAVRRLAQNYSTPMRVIAKSFAKQNGVGLKQVRACRRDAA